MSEFKPGQGSEAGDASRPDDEKIALLTEFARRSRETVRQQLSDPSALKVFKLLEAAGIPVLMLKGAGTRDLLYGDLPRASIDVDLIVSPESLVAAERALLAAGMTKSQDHHAADDVVEVLHSSVWSGQDGEHLDLHFKIPFWEAPIGEIWTLLWEARTEIELLGESVTVPSTVARTLHVVTHAAQEGQLEGRAREELQMAVARFSDEHWLAVSDLANKVGAAEPFAAGLRLCDTGKELASRLGVAEASKLLWQLENSGERPRGFVHLEALRNAETWRKRVAIIYRVLLPRRDWIVQEHPWARRNRPSMIVAYFAHFGRVGRWAAESIIFSRRANKAGG